MERKLLFPNNAILGLSVGWLLDGTTRKITFNNKLFCWKTPILVAKNFS